MSLRYHVHCYVLTLLTLMFVSGRSVNNTSSGFQDEDRVLLLNVL